MNERFRKITKKTNFALFLSIAAPEARAEELRTLFDWGNWVRRPAMFEFSYAEYRLDSLINHISLPFRCFHLMIVS